jgi:formylmethanofuran dehydrogenase subunit E
VLDQYDPQTGGFVSTHESDSSARPGMEECVRFHGHLCPGLSIGFKAAAALLAALRVKRAEDEELVTIVKTDACGADAMQVMTGCTFGKGNFLFKNYGKHAFTLASRRSGRAFRACLKAGAVMPDPVHRALLQKVQGGIATPEEAERYKALHLQAADRVLQMTAEDLFSIEEVAMELPPKARVVASEVCPSCGEPVRVDYLTSSGGAAICPGCRERRGSPAA